MTFSAVSAFAYTDAANEEGAASVTETDGTVRGALDGADISGGANDGSATADGDNRESDSQNEDAATDGEEDDGGFIEDAYELLLSNADKLFALLAFLSSLLVGFAYKKGLLPFVKTALSALATGVANLKEESLKAEESAGAVLRCAEEKLTRAEECVNLISERIAAIEKELSAAKEDSMKDAELRLILNSQIELLYEIFMSSSLPTYQKDAVGARFAEMKRALEKETEKK
jgi:hypothetical protein